MGFQDRVNLYQPLAVAGDFASANPYATVYAADGAFVAGPNGVTVGKFAWVSADGRTVTSYGENTSTPYFVHRNQQASLPNYLQEFGNTILGGFPLALMEAGDFFALVEGATAATVGASVYARNSDGGIVIGAAPTGASATASIGATFTATATGTSLAVTSVTGKISVGDVISGTGVPAGTTITAGPGAGGAGAYTTSVATTAAAATVTSFGNVLHVTAVGSGVLNIGDAISGTGVPTNASIASQLSGSAGSTGDYTISIPASAYAASTTVTVVDGTLTKFVAKSVAAVGSLVVISTWGN